MTRWRLIPALAWLATIASAGASPDELLARAREVRLKAEKGLAEARQRRLGERKTLAAALQKQYAALAAARGEVARARDALEQVEADSVGVERESALTDHRIRAAIAQAADAAGAALDPSGPLDAMERTIWEGLQGRLARAESRLEVTVGPQSIVARDGNSPTWRYCWPFLSRLWKTLQYSRVVSNQVLQQASRCASV